MSYKSEEDWKRSLLLPGNLEAPVNDGIAPRVNNRNLFLASAAVSIGSLCIGITLGMSSPMIPDMLKDKSANALTMTASDYSWFGSLVSLGGMVGGLFGGFFMQLFGRKMTTMLCGLPFVGGMLLMAYSSNVAMLLAGRTITGFSAGVASLVVPTYISETSTEQLRGFLGSANQLNITVGILLSYVFGIFLTWRWLCIAAAVPCAMLTVFTAFIPETPRFLLIQRKRRESRHSLAFFRGESADIDEELRALEEILGNSASSASWLDVIREKGIRTPLLLSLGVMFFQQWSGIDCVLFYSKSIFMNAGFTSEKMLNIAMILFAVVQVIATGISCLIMDKAGRKVLLIVSGLFVAISSGTFGLYFQLTASSRNGTNHDPGLLLAEYSSTDSANLNWLALASLLIYVSAFAIGLGPIPWLLLSEIIPMRARGKASGLSMAVNWMLAFTVTKEFQDMENAFTSQGTFWMFSGICLVGVFYHGCLLPETKGKTLEEITSFFEGDTQPLITPYRAITPDDDDD